MRPQDFDFYLPEHLIAQQPLAERTASRLLVPGQDGCQDSQFSNLKFSDLPDLLGPGDLLVMNDVRVVPARLLGRKTSGGQVELLLERILDDQQALVHIRASNAPRAGTVLEFEPGFRVEVIGRELPFFVVRFPGNVLALLEEHGHVPLPPYIRRDDTDADRARYQTVYAREPAAVAAPTAGLHFDDELLDKIRRRGVEVAFLTLAVGAGTFKPVGEEELAAGKLHAEYYEVSEALCETVNRVRSGGGRVIATGTTVVRALESAAEGGELVQREPFH